jgi:hypothetical protein
MLKSINLLLAFASCIILLISSSLAQTSDRALLATFCDTGNIKGKTCTRARAYPNAPKKGCDVTLTGDRAIGKFLGGNPLLLASYESGCEAHTTDNGGVVVLEQSGGAYVFRGYQPGMQATCITVAKDAELDVLACLTGHVGQGIMETGVALMKFAANAKGIALSFDFLVRAEDSVGAFGANRVTCKERPPRYFQLDKLKPGPRPMTVSLEASWADAETISTACGKGFARPAEAIGDPVPGDAWMPDDRIRNGKVVVDLVTRKVTAQSSAPIVSSRHCEEPTGPARLGRPDDRLRDEAIHSFFCADSWIASLRSQ